MSIALQCTNGHQFQVTDDFAGRKTLCPTCQWVVDVPAETPAAKTRPSPPASAGTNATAANPERPVPVPWQYRLREGQGGLVNVHFGLVLHHYRILFVALALMILLAASLESVFWRNRLERDLSSWILAFLATNLVAAIVGIAGSAYCLKAPVESESRTAITMSLIFDVVQFGLAIGLPVLAVGPYLMLIPFTCGLGGWVFLMLFLQRLAAHLRAADLESVSRSQLARGLCLIVGQVVLGLAVILLPIVLMIPWIGWLPLLALVALAFAAIQFLADFLKLLENLREVIRGERETW